MGKLKGPSTQPVAQTKPHNTFRRFDESPRQVISGSVLLIALTGIAYYNNNRHKDDYNEGESFRFACCGTLFILMTYCFLNTRDGQMKRPHPGFWRMLHGSSLWYALMAAILLVVHPEDGVTIMRWLFPNIQRTDERGPMEGVGGNIPMEGGRSNLGMDHLDCEITKDTIYRQVFGLWFFAHAVGWFAKMLILRDLRTCLVYSSVFEMIELTLQAFVPEFQECWWDSLILDWFIANLLIGMNAGILAHGLLNWPSLNWSQDYPLMSTLKLSKIIAVLTPSSWIKYNWNPDNDPFSLVLNSVIWIIMCVGEVNSFFLINILQLPREHVFNIARQVWFCFCALPACEEWYEYTRHVRVHNTGYATKEYKKNYMDRTPRIGQTVWLLTVTIGLETAAVLKYSFALGLFSNATTFDIRYWGPWLASATIFLSYWIIHCWLFYRRARQYPTWLMLLKWSSVLPLLLLGGLYAF